MNIDVATTFDVFLILAGIGVLICIVLAIKSINAGKHLKFYKKRQDMIEFGWRLILFAVFLGVVSFLVFRLGEPVVYRYFPPSPTITRTPTITPTPTITVTMQETYTPTITMTLAQTYTPSVPDVVQTAILTPVGVDNSAVFSIIQFSTQTKDGVVVNTADTFTQPVSQMFGGYSYDKVAAGVQWTAVWLYEGAVICYETKVWNFSPGGYGYTDACNEKFTSADWRPGNYEVQIFVGQTWKNSGTFTILADGQSAETTPSLTGNPPVPTMTPSPTSSQ